MGQASRRPSHHEAVGDRGQGDSTREGVRALDVVLGCGHFYQERTDPDWKPEDGIGHKKPSKKWRRRDRSGSRQRGFLRCRSACRPVGWFEASGHRRQDIPRCPTMRRLGCRIELWSFQQEHTERGWKPEDGPARPSCGRAWCPSWVTTTRPRRSRSAACRRWSAARPGWGSGATAKRWFPSVQSIRQLGMVERMCATPGMLPRGH